MSAKKTVIVTEELQSERYAVIEVRHSEVVPDNHRRPHSLRHDLRHRVGLGKLDV